MTEDKFMQQIHKAFGSVMKQVDVPDGTRLIMEIGLSDRPHGPPEITLCTGCTVDEETRKIVPLPQYLIEKPLMN